MTRRSALAGLTLVLVVGCGVGRNHESLGDRAYAESQFDAALAEYRLAIDETPSSRLFAKAGQAGLRSGQLLIAAEQFIALAADPDRISIAADGLERVAGRAVTADNYTALQAALSGLRTVAEGRAIGLFARELAANLGESPRTQEAVDILPYAAVALSGVGQMDSLMHVYGAVLRRLGRCETAVPVFESLVRRARLTEVGILREHGSYCALRVAQTRLQRGLPGESRPWFQRAIDLDGPESNRRAAYLGLGDALVQLDDYVGAISAYERAREGLFFTDPMYDVVQRRLNSIFDAGTRFR